MGKEAEAKILEPFKARAEKGEKVEISEIAEAYQAAVDHPVGGGQICCVLKRHGWRKAMPRSRHLKKASEEAIAASKMSKIVHETERESRNCCGKVILMFQNEARFGRINKPKYLLVRNYRLPGDRRLRRI